MFARIRAIGLWLLNSVVTPDEFETFDENLSNALDGAGGGAYAPTAQLVIGGAGLVAADKFSAPGIALFNVQAYGAIGDGTTDDTAAILAAITAAHNFLGGTVFFPPGTYRISSALACHSDVSLFGVPGATTITLNHATANLLQFHNSTGTTNRVRVSGLRFQAVVANTGRVISNDSTTPVRVLVENCHFGVNANLTGRMAYIQGASEFTFRDCHFALQQIATKGIHTTHASARLVIDDCKFVVPASYETIIVHVEGGIGQVSNSYFDCTAGPGAAASCVGTSADSLTVTGNVFDGGGTQFAISWESGCYLHATGNQFRGIKPYSAAGLAQLGSVIELAPLVGASSALTSFSITDGYETAVIEATGTAPTINMPTKLFPGQKMVLWVTNNSGGNWTAIIDVAGPPIDSVAVDDQQTVSAVFQVVDPTFSGTYEWKRVGAWSTAT